MHSQAQLYICPRLLATGHFPKEKTLIFCFRDATQTCRHPFPPLSGAASLFSCLSKKDKEKTSRVSLQTDLWNVG